MKKLLLFIVITVSFSVQLSYGQSWWRMGIPWSPVPSIDRCNINNLVVIASWDGTLRIMDYQSGNGIALLNDPVTRIDIVHGDTLYYSGLAPYNDAKFSPDGKYLAAGIAAGGIHGGIIRIYDATTWQIVKDINAFQRSCERLAWSHNGKFLAASGYTGEGMTLWKTAEWDSVGSFSLSDSSWTSDLLFTPSDEQLCIAVKDSILLWNINSKKVQKSITGLTPARMTLSESTDRLLATIGTSTQVIDLTTGKIIYQFEIYGSSGCISPDGLSMAYGSFGKIILRDFATSSEEIIQSDWNLPERIVFSADGKSIMGISNRSLIRADMQSLAAKERITAHIFFSRTPYSSFSFNSTHSAIISIDRSGNTCYHWSLSGISHSITNVIDSTTAVCPIPSSSNFLVANQKGRIYEVDSSGTNIIREFSNNITRPTYQIQVTPNGKFIIAISELPESIPGYPESIIYCIDINTGAIVGKSTRTEPANDIAFFGDTLVLAQGWGFATFHVPSVVPIDGDQFFNTDWPAISVNYIKHSAQAVVGGDTAIAILNLSNNTILKTWKTNIFTHGVELLDNERIAVGPTSTRGSVQFININTGESVREVFYTGEELNQLILSPNKKSFSVTSRLGSVIRGDIPIDLLGISISRQPSSQLRLNVISRDVLECNVDIPSTFIGKEFTLKIVDAIGNIRETFTRNAVSSSNQVLLTKNNLHSGVYFAVLSIGDSQLSQTFLITN